MLQKKRDKKGKIRGEAQGKNDAPKGRGMPDNEVADMREAK